MGIKACLCAFLGLTTWAVAADPALVEAARKEGSVTWYTTYIVDQSVRPMIAGFEKAYPGIKVQFVRQASADLVFRISNEVKAGKIPADLFDGNSTFAPLRAAGLVEPWRPDSAAFFPREYADKDGWWTANTVTFIGVMTNTNLIAAADRPRSYEDLLSPKLTGRMVWSVNPDLSAAAGFIGNVLMGMGEQKGMDYLRRLVKQNITGIQSSSRQVVDQVIAGEYAVGLQTLAHQETASLQAGAPIAWIALSPTMSSMNTVSLVKGGPHPNAARLLIDFLLSEAGQSIFAEPGYIPPRPGVKARNPAHTPQVGQFTTNVVAPDFDNAEIARWQFIYRDLFH